MYNRFIDGPTNRLLITKSSIRSLTVGAANGILLTCGKFTELEVTNVTPHVNGADIH